MPSTNNILTEKLKDALAINNSLRKQIEELSDQNKQLSTTINILSLDKLSLQTEINSIRNSNAQLTAMHNIMNKKMSALEQTIQSCIVPALVTISQQIPSILESVDQMSKFEIKNFIKENKEKKTNTVRPMIKGVTIFTQPVIQLIKCDDMLPSIKSSITEQPQRSTKQPRCSTEQTPKRPRKLSYRSSSHSKINMEPHVIIEDVTVMLKSLKAVPNEKGPKHQLNENLGEGPSSLYAPENQTQNSNNSTKAIQNVQSSPRSTTVNEVQFDVTTIASTSSGITYNTFDGTEERRSGFISSIYPSMMRKRTRRSSESSSVSDIDDPTSS
ncbi:uncharacterized protein LOC132933539 [Metopolophium dirhodum]|uniref:uncharacterized protein LOC132933537 n=1 Tax=Metopolophium dirhodum TaxID=44670 RepID=UPI00298FD87E|nr:uncharacterized protein LOC132933537 [Metopolophium dirhodum]XP_060855796.1 uncharacterized protein LOC132933539 [Metopolophium dirhodum]